MKFKISLILATTLLCLIFSRVSAQTNDPNITPSHLQAAEKFLIATGINTQFEAIADNMVATLGKSMPEDKRVAFAVVMKKFMNKYYTWDGVKTEMCKIYAEELSESELQQLTDFFNTPTGKKYGQKLPALMQKGMLMGQQIVVQHQAELQEMMQEAFKGQ